MAIDFTNLNTGLNALNAQLTETVAGEDSVEVLLNAQKDAIAAAVLVALQASDGVTQPIIDNAVAAINITAAAFHASAGKLADAAANAGPNPAPAPAPVVAPAVAAARPGARGVRA